MLNSKNINGGHMGDQEHHELYFLFYIGFDLTEPRLILGLS